MGHGSDEELEDQATRAQEATPGGIEQPGATWRERLRSGYRDLTAPVRSGLQQVRTWAEGLPKPVRWLALAGLIGVASVVPFILNATLGVLSGYWMDIVTKIG